MSAPLVPLTTLGKSGLKISKIILGCMTYGSPDFQGGWCISDPAECKSHVEAALKIGINTFDTADVYSNGESEIFLGRALKELKVPRSDVVILTKSYFGMEVKPGESISAHAASMRKGNSRKHIFESVQGSLKRLDTDYIDVFQLHRFDDTVPIEETMQALHDVVQKGWVRHIGMSSCWAFQFSIMQNYAINHGLTPFISMQNFYTCIYREEEREMNRLLEHYGVGSIPWSPLARGVLTRPNKARKESTRASKDPYVEFLQVDEATEKIVDEVERISKAKDVSMAQVAIAWLLSKPVVSAPIIGSSKVSNIEDIAKGCQLKLTEEEIKAIEAPYKARAVVGHWG